MALIVGDNMSGSCGDRQLKQYLVTRIGEGWSPSEKYLLMSRRSAQGIQISRNRFWRKTWNHTRPEQNILILQENGNGKRHGESPQCNVAQDFARRSTFGAQRRDHDIGINNKMHIRYRIQYQLGCKPYFGLDVPDDLSLLASGVVPAQAGSMTEVPKA